MFPMHRHIAKGWFVASPLVQYHDVAPESSLYLLFDLVKFFFNLRKGSHSYP